MKNAKRLLSLILSFAITASVFGVLTMISYAETKSFTIAYDGAGDPGYTNDYYTLPNGAGEWNGIQRKQNSVLENAGIVFNTFYSSDSRSSAGTWTDSSTGTVYPNLAAKGEYGVGDNGIYKFVNYGCSNLSNIFWIDSWGNGDTTDIIFKLQNYVTPKAFSMINRKTKAHQAAYYELYASGNKDDLFAEENKIATYDRTDQIGKTSDELDDRTINLIEFQGVGEIAYFAMRIKYPNPTNTGENSFRSGAIMLCGDVGEAVAKDNVTDDNLRAIETENVLTGEVFSDDMDAVQFTKLQDGTLTTAEAWSNKTVFAEPGTDGTPIYYTDGSRSVKIGYDLGEVKNIDKLAVYNHDNIAWRTYDYELYASNDKDTLFYTSNKIQHYVNGLATQRQIFDYTNDSITARYVGIKVLFPSYDRAQKWLKIENTSSAAVRITEFRAYGTTASVEQGAKSYYNDFENVVNFNNSNWVVEETGDAAHGKALATPKSTNWFALMSQSDTLTNAKYVLNRNAYRLFNEELELNAPYILQYDYQKADDDTAVNNILFSFGLQHENFKNNDGDYTDYIVDQKDRNWHTRTVGFTASETSPLIKINNMGQNVKCYIDNFTLKQAATISYSDGSIVGTLSDIGGNILLASKTLNKLTVVPLGETAKFKIPASSGTRIVKVSCGGNDYYPDSVGVITIPAVTGNITVSFEKYTNAAVVTDDCAAKEMFKTITSKSLVSGISPVLSYYAKGESGFEKLPKTAGSLAAVNDNTVTTGSAIGVDEELYNFTKDGVALNDGSEVYATFEYDLKQSSAISNIIVASAESTEKRLSYYKLFASDDYNKLYNSESLIYDCDNSDMHRRQLLSWQKGELSARYVALMVISPDSLTTERNIRVDEFNIYGFNNGFSYNPIETTQEDVWKTQNEYEQFVNRNRSLIVDALPLGVTAFRDGKVIETKGNMSELTNTCYLDNSLTIYEPVFVTDNGKVIDSLIDDESKQYVQIDYKLNSEGTVTGFGVVGHINRRFSPSHYKLSLANSREELFGENAKTYDVYSRSNAGTVILDEPVSAKYAAIRVICSNMPEVLGEAVRSGWNASAFYTRLTHFDIIGTYNSTVTDNVTASSQYEFINVEKSEINGFADAAGNYAIATVTVKAPLSANDGSSVYKFKGWYENGTLVSGDAKFVVSLSDTARNLVASYDKFDALKVSFCERNGKVVYTAYVKSGDTVDSADFAAASAKVPEIYGYIRKLNSNGCQVWNNATDMPITSDIVFSAIYTKNDEKHSVSLKKVDGTTEYADIAFDERMTISDESATGFKLNDKFISYGNTLTLHNCGEMNFTASAEEVTPKATVSIIGSRKINNAMTVFAYIYTPEGTSIESRGIRFISGTSYDKLGGDIAWNETNRGNCKVQELLFTKSGSHMMVTLYGITTEKTVRRAAQAFATVKTANGTEEIFSNAVCETFKTTKLNPIVKYDKQTSKTADPMFSYRDGYYYHAYNDSTGKAVRVEKSADPYDWENAENIVAFAYTDVYRDWYAPEIFFVDGHWYIFAAPTVEAGSVNHRMCVLKSVTDDAMGEWQNLGVMSGMIESQQLNIDGTYFEYNGQKYFVWTTEGELLVDTLADDMITLSGNPVSVCKADYDWEKRKYNLVEGPAILQHNGRVFMTYSANDSNSDYYCIGLLSLKEGGNPMNASDWVKNPEPVLDSVTDGDMKIYGPGHNGFTKIYENGNEIDCITYMGNLISGSGWSGRNTFIQQISWDNDGNPVFMKPSAYVK